MVRVWRSFPPVQSRKSLEKLSVCPVRYLDIPLPATTHWIRQPAGKSLEWMGFSGLGLGYHAKKFEGRMETTKDTSNSMLTLMLSGVRAEDSAVYYCARDTVV
nr:Ig heavy chain V-I region HG3 precursor [Salmo salar]